MSSNCPSVTKGCMSAFHIRHARRVALFLSFLMLSNCAREPVINVPPHYAREARLVPPDTELLMSDGAHIPLRIWLPARSPRVVVLAIHGFNDSRDAWEESAAWFTKEGIAVVAPDVRGFGGTAERGHWAGEKRLLDDISTEIDWIHHHWPDAGVVLAGESMGGGLAMLAMAQPYPPEVDGVILLAPAVWSVGFLANIPVRLAAALHPSGLVTGRELPVHVTASDNVRALIRLYFDPLTIHATRLDTLHGLIGMMGHAAQLASRIRTPVLLVYGTNDQLIPAEAVHDMLEKAGKNWRIDIVPGGHHLLLRDRGGQRVAEDMIAWMLTSDAFLPSVGDISAGIWNSMPEDNRNLFFLLPSRLDGLAPE